FRRIAGGRIEITESDCAIICSDADNGAALHRFGAVGVLEFAHQRHGDDDGFYAIDLHDTTVARVINPGGLVCSNARRFDHVGPFGELYLDELAEFGGGLLADLSAL